MKKVVETVGADIETVSVDSLEVRTRLLEDDMYGIDEIPAVLLLYSSGQHKTYMSHSLDEWFNQLLQNIKDYQQQQQMAMQVSQSPVVDDSEEWAYTPIDDGIPKELRRKPVDIDRSNIPTSLPSPGRPHYNDEMGEGISGSGMTGGGISSAQAAMISEHIKDAAPLVPITSDPHIQAGRKEVKKEGLSAAEIAKQMAEQREVYEEKLEENRPFM